MKELGIDDMQRLPSSFYRVSVKVLIHDDTGRLLVGFDDKGRYQIPGGGWEFDETIEECVRREIMEELHAEVTAISPVEFILRGTNRHGFKTVRIVVRAVLVPGELVPGDDIVSLHYVDRGEFMKLNFAGDDEEFPGAADKIWDD